MKYITYNIIIIIVVSCVACDSKERRIQQTIEKMYASPISIPYDKLICWTDDSILEHNLKEQPELQLVHYVDSTLCSSCYLSKITLCNDLFEIESRSRNKFRNVIIVEPGKKMSNMRKLYYEYQAGVLPKTIYIDSACVFKKNNSSIPKGMIFHTFLIDENNKVIYVGNPLVSKKVKDDILQILRKKM